MRTDWKKIAESLNKKLDAKRKHIEFLEYVLQKTSAELAIVKNIEEYHKSVGQ